ncbi:MAG: site-2 protease family protein [Sedimentisphaeraceae bacterium JB056]
MNENKLNKILPLLIVFGILGYLVVQNWEVAGNIIVALLGFGMLVFVHELGHFLAARKNDVECEAFAIGMAIGTPFLIGVKKVQKGWRLRILPKTSGVKDEFAEDDCLAMMNIGSGIGQGDTEYCLGPLPIGGFVKMVGQDDSGPVDLENDDNPRSFANKSVGARMMITSAGVLANIFTAFLIFLGLAFYGIERVPAIVGDVVDGYPAAEAGLQPGDEIIEIAGKSRMVGGKSNLDFTHLALAPMLGKRDEPIEMKVKSPEGEIRELAIVPAEMVNGNYGFGIEKPSVLRLANIADDDGYYEEIGLNPDDEVYAVNGEPVTSTNEFDKIVEGICAQSVTISARRDIVGENTFEAVSTEIEMTYSPGVFEDDKLGLANICSLVPLLKIEGGPAMASGSEKDPVTNEKFAEDDLIVKVGDVDYPTFLEFREVVESYRNRQMPVKVLRKASDGQRVLADVLVTPKAENKEDRPLIGVLFNLDMSGNFISGVVDSQTIPAGAKIVSVNGAAVSNFFDIAKLVKEGDETIEVGYIADGSEEIANASIEIDKAKPVEVSGSLKMPIPFDDYRRMYKAGNPIEAFQMGGYLILDMVDQAVSSLKGLLLKRVSADEMSGPVGIARISYRIVQQRDLAFFLYFLGMISCFLAVFNFLPIPVVDGGLFVLLVIEKIKGSPVSFTVQKYLVYIGLGLLGALFIFVTFNDILKIAKGML